MRTQIEQSVARVFFEQMVVYAKEAANICIFYQ
jgi:hypothetical protein